MEEIELITHATRKVPRLPGKSPRFINGIIKYLREKVLRTTPIMSNCHVSTWELVVRTPGLSV